VAFLIPENLSTRRDVPTAASRLAKALREALDDDATVWYEPLFGGGQERPDIVALVPDTGVLVLEILGAKSGALRGTRDGNIVIVDRTMSNTSRRPRSLAPRPSPQISRNV